ncbi:hypothetical protein IAD21_01645 [Abditibacteriota bacterium]|nr:hypothetical protein IAD21_01645 [Abditibacteriota bacterium]
MISSLLKAIVCLVVPVSLSICRADTPQKPQPRVAPIPVFTGGILLQPPAQDKKWVGDASPLSDATRKLFAAGMADPRGLPYREITVVVGELWSGGGGRVKTHGWVFDHNKFAVCWNGLVYPLVSVGKPASVRADVATFLAADAKQRADAKKRDPEFGFHRFGSAFNEGWAVSSEVILPLKAILLRRLGETTLAKRVLSAWEDGGPFDKTPERLASDWTWACFDRAVCAHMRGDDVISLLMAQQLMAARPLLQKLATDDQQKEMWDEAATLLQDEKRRLAQKKATAPTDEVAAAIQDLQNVNARQWGQPGGVYLAMDPRVQKMVALGDRAVEPLLTALETETRLTRSVGFHRDFFRYRYLISTAQAETVALEALLKTQFSEAKDRKSLIAQIRAFWQKNKGVSIAERPYRTLQDDGATPQQWLDAAQEITRPANVQRFGNVTQTSMLAPGIKASLTGESLRTKTDPGVSELLTRRSNALAKGEDSTKIEIASQLALLLANWDAEAARPVVLARMKQLSAQPSQPFGPARIMSALRRSIEGDAQADAIYIAWLKASPRTGENSFDYFNLFSPLWKYRDQKRWQDAAQTLFSDAKSPWYGALGRSTEGHYVPDVNELLRLPLWAVGPFNAAIRRDLANQTIIGNVTVKAAYRINFEIFNSWSSEWELPAKERSSVKIGEKIPLRVCDVVAYQLSDNWHDFGAPSFGLYWSAARRGKAIAEFQIWIRVHQDDRALLQKWQKSDWRDNDFDTD